MTVSRSRRPLPEETSCRVHQSLIDRMQEDCVFEVMNGQLFWMCELAACLSPELIDKVHPPYQWTVRQVLAHVADAERIWGTRMLRTAAGDTTPLPPWDENAYAETRFGLGSVKQIVGELGCLRQANMALLQRIRVPAWNRIGCVGDARLSVRAMAWVMTAHLQHHFEIIQARCELTVQRVPKMS